MELCKGCRWMAERLAERLADEIPNLSYEDRQLEIGKIKLRIGQRSERVLHSTIHKEINDAYMKMEDQPEFLSFVTGRKSVPKNQSLLQYAVTQEYPRQSKQVEFMTIDNVPKLSPQELRKLAGAAERAKLDPESPYLEYDKIKSYTNIYERLALKHKFSPTKVVISKVDGSLLTVVVRQQRQAIALA